MWKVIREKIRNVKIDETNIKTFYVGETLPEGYNPPISYIENKIVEEIKEADYVQNRKTR